MFLCFILTWNHGFISVPLSTANVFIYVLLARYAVLRRISFRVDFSIVSRVRR